jgi:hypothetical protein
MYFTGFVDGTGQFQDTLCRGRFTRINMGKNTYISVFI